MFQVKQSARNGPFWGPLAIAPQDYGYGSLSLNPSPFSGNLELLGFKDPAT
jgi:hypothetical protein